MTKKQKEIMQQILRRNICDGIDCSQCLFEYPCMALEVNAPGHVMVRDYLKMKGIKEKDFRKEK